MQNSSPVAMLELERRTVAVFDFDGTLTRSDTLLPYLRLAAGNPRLLKGLGSAAIAWRHRNEDGRDLAKRRLLKVALRDLPEASLRATGERYAAALLVDAMRPEIVERLDAHRDRGDRVVIVSASLDFYLEPMAHMLGVHDLICCRVESLSGGHSSGELLGVNPRGESKVDLLHDLLGAGATVDFAYGNDPVSDGPMLAMADSGTLVGVDTIALLGEVRHILVESSACVQRADIKMRT